MMKRIEQVEMADQFPTRMQLSQELNEAITPYFTDRHFKVVGTVEDEISQVIWESIGDGTHSRRFARSISLGFETFELRFTQYTDSETEQGFIGVGTEFGIHLKDIEQLVVKLDIAPNPFRLGKYLPDIWEIDREILRITQLQEIESAIRQITSIVESDGVAFWSKYQTLDDIMHYFNSWSSSERYSPKGSAHVTNYLLILAYLKQDQELFNQIIAEYSPYIQGDVYRPVFDHLVDKLSREFGKSD